MKPYIHAQAIERYEDNIKNFGGLERFDQIKKATQLLKSIFSLEDDFFKDTFGNHVKVIVTKNGSKIEEYEHD